MNLPWRWLGRVDHATCAQNQRAHRDAIIEGRADEEIWMVEHPPTITVGRRIAPGTPPASVLERYGVAYTVTERGGLATYHGPGQLVAYPMIRLPERGFTVKGYIARLERVVIDMLSSYGLEAGRREDARGVFVGPDKIAAIGVHIRRGVSIHGLAVNVAPNLRHFGLIIPCGLTDVGVTSMAAHKISPLSMEEIAANLGRRLAVDLATY